MALTNYHTKYSNSVIPLIPNPLYQISRIRYTKYSKYEDNKIEKNIYRNIQISVKQMPIIYWFFFA